MQIIVKQAFHFLDAVMEPDTDNNLVRKVRNSMICQPSFRPQNVPDWVANDATFKAGVAAELIEVL